MPNVEVFAHSGFGIIISTIEINKTNIRLINYYDFRIDLMVFCFEFFSLFF